MRSHEGLLPAKNAQPWDKRVIREFTRLANIFVALRDYRRTLYAEAAAAGTPVVRAMALHYLGDGYPSHGDYVDTVCSLKHQYLLGRDILVCPVLEPKAHSVKLWIPPNTGSESWVNIFTGERIRRGAGSAWRAVSAPLGSPAAFARLCQNKMNDELKAAVDAIRNM